MSLSKPLRLALTALSRPDLHIQKTYKIVRSVTRVTHWPRLNPLYKPWDHKISRAGHTVPVRIFTPDHTETPARLFLFFHGGGWVTGDIDSYSDVCVRLSNAMGAKVASVDYGLAPEHRFPEGLEDCYAAMQEALRVAGLLKMEVVLIGDSAGGNLAAACSLLARDRGGRQADAQVLLYPSTYPDHNPKTTPFASVRENGRDNLLTARRVEEYIELYERTPEDRQNPYFAPLIAGDLRNQPPTLVVTAELDPLRDEGEAYARRLSLAGNAAECHRLPDALHGYLSAMPPAPGGAALVRRTYGLIRAFLARRSAADALDGEQAL